MFACILILILFLPAALLPCVLREFFSSRELREMGIRLEEYEVADAVKSADVPSASYCLCT